ncbi:MAG: helix-hairpin-helix domain-containing protein [Bacteroidia bacterium]
MKKRRKRKLNTAFHQYFDFSYREKKGLLILAFILLLQIILLCFIRSYHRKVPLPSAELILAFEKECLKSASEKVKPSFFKKDSLFNFDPNVLNADQWESLGLSAGQSASVVHYVQKGGKFRTKKDICKIFGIQPSLAERLMPFVLLPDSLPSSIQIKHDKYKREAGINLNTADSIQLDRLPGIGPVLASRIVRYRDRLGGFFSVEQLREVYGISDSLFLNISGRIEVGDFKVRKIKLNSDSLAILKSHPYIGYKLAQLVDKYRLQHPFKSVDELHSLPLLTDENFRKLAPYLTVE